MWIIILYVVAVILYSIIYKLGKNKKPVKKSIYSIFTGLFCLIIVNCLSVITKVYIPFSLMSILVSSLGGIPGITLLLSINLLH